MLCRKSVGKYSFFVDIGELERNNKIQKAMIEIKKQIWVKNAIVKGMDLQDRATTNGKK